MAVEVPPTKADWMPISEAELRDVILAVVEEVLTSDEERVGDKVTGDLMVDAIKDVGLELYPASEVPGLIQPQNLAQTFSSLCGYHAYWNM